MTSAVIVLASDKGGSGKTTAARCLATYWHAIEQRRVALIDCDPSLVLEKWHRNSPYRQTMPLMPRVTVDTISSAVDKLRDDFDVTIIDCPGSEGNLEVLAYGSADMVVIPLTPDDAAVRAAVRTHLKVKQTEMMLRNQNQKHNLTMVNATIHTRALMMAIKQRTHLEKYIERLLDAQSETGLERLPVSLRHSNVYGETTFNGQTPTLVDPSSNQAHDIRRVAQMIGKQIGLPVLKPRHGVKPVIPVSSDTVPA